MKIKKEDEAGIASCFPAEKAVLYRKQSFKTLQTSCRWTSNNVLCVSGLVCLTGHGGGKIPVSVWLLPMEC